LKLRAHNRPRTDLFEQPHRASDFFIKEEAEGAIDDEDPKINDDFDDM
jgi:hypothetical protein